MRKHNKLGFTLVELLVVITILAIISVVAYQNFGGAVDKAVGGRKISDVSTIETALQQYKSDNNFYPSVDTYSGANNVWGYNSAIMATPSNKIVVTFNGEEIDTLSGVSIGGGKVFGIGAWYDLNNGKQIGAKGTISQMKLTKKYLSKDLYDPEIGDIKVKFTSNKMIDYGVGRYVYATFKKNTGSGSWTTNMNGNAYNIAYTVKKDGSDKYVTKIVGDYDSDSCYDEDKANCPATLIGSGTTVLVDKSEQNGISNAVNYGIPYAVTDFSK